MHTGTSPQPGALLTTALSVTRVLDCHALPICHGRAQTTSGAASGAGSAAKSKDAAPASKNAAEEVRVGGSTGQQA
jgi:hypothetical protein